MGKILKLTVIGGVIIFVWGMLSWTILPWHQTVSHSFSNENLVGEFIKSQAKEPGVYYLPWQIDQKKPGVPSIFINILPDGMQGTMGSMMAMAMVINLLFAFFMVFLLSKSTATDFRDRLMFVTTTGLFLALFAHLPMFVWFEFPLDYTIVNILDHTIGWFLAGIGISKFAQARAND